MSQRKHVTYGRTESGDDLPVLIWPKSPTDEEVDAKYRELLPTEYEEVGFVNWSKDTEEVIR